ncbi:hypothetical protein ESA94_13690 [Lacibacter luteus]|uniref:Uncharacterized protein n=1 Tax=Lacibacter luteus TaxID=2508719 RepID=A0A4Q1CGB6_9BACT|nr:DUF6263 family protein [Lacibacter luteus]RXK59188.1 hypothetical protein ESA94_13690 [Lacibacter luteus]
MKKLLVCILCFVMWSCRFVPSDDKNHENYLKEGPGYQLVFDPEPGTVYQYTIVNKSNSEMKVSGKEITNNNSSDIAFSYLINKDTGSGFSVGIEYSKIHLSSKVGDTETEMDAGNAKYSTNPIEKLLGALKESKINIVLDRTGKVKEVAGYEELTNNVFEQLRFTDTLTASIARQQWNHLVLGSLVKQNAEQFFGFFPDSTVHLHEKWKASSSQKGEFGLKTTTTYFVKAVTENEVFIESSGEISSDNNEIASRNGVTSTNLTGLQEGEYVMERKTGMILKASISAKIKGSVQMRGMDIPIDIKNTVEINSVK